MLTSVSVFFAPSQPKQIKEIKEFLVTARRKDAKSVKIMKSKKVCYHCSGMWLSFGCDGRMDLVAV